MLKFGHNDDDDVSVDDGGPTFLERLAVAARDDVDVAYDLATLAADLTGCATMSRR